MKTVARLLAFAFLLIPPSVMAAEHPFFRADYSQGKVFIVSADGRVEWEHKVTSLALCRSGCA